MLLVASVTLIARPLPGQGGLSAPRKSRFSIAHIGDCRRHPAAHRRSATAGDEPELGRVNSTMSCCLRIAEASIPWQATGEATATTIGEATARTPANATGSMTVHEHRGEPGDGPRSPRILEKKPSRVIGHLPGRSGVAPWRGRHDHRGHRPDVQPAEEKGIRWMAPRPRRACSEQTGGHGQHKHNLAATITPAFFVARRSSACRGSRLDVREFRPTTRRPPPRGPVAQRVMARPSSCAWWSRAAPSCWRSAAPRDR